MNLSESYKKRLNELSGIFENKPNNPDWKILSFQGIAGGPFYRINRDGYYFPDKGDSLRNRLLSTMLHISTEPFGGYRIYSVKRMADGKVFTIGNTAKSNNNHFVISRIDLVDNVPYLNKDSINLSIFEVK